MLASPDREAAFRRLQRLALAGEVLAGASALLMGAYVGFACVDADRFADLTQRMLPHAAVKMTSAQWTGSVAVVAGLNGLFVLVVWRAAALFRLLRQGERFGPAIECALTRLARAALAGAIGSVLGKAVLGLILTWGNPAGHRMLAFAISSDDVVGLLAAILFVLFARIVAEGRRIDEENRGFV